MGLYPEKIQVELICYLNGLYPTVPVHLPVWCEDGQVVHASVEERVTISIWKWSTKLATVSRSSVWVSMRPSWMVTWRSHLSTSMSCFRLKVMLQKAKSIKALLHLSPGASNLTRWLKWPMIDTILEEEYQSNISRILAMDLLIFHWFCAITPTIWSSVSSPGLSLRYSSQEFHRPGGLDDLRLTFTFWIKPLGLVVAPPLRESQADSKSMAKEHSVGGAMVNTWWHTWFFAFLAL